MPSGALKPQRWTKHGLKMVEKTRLAKPLRGKKKLLKTMDEKEPKWMRWLGAICFESRSWANHPYGCFIPPYTKLEMFFSMALYTNSKWGSSTQGFIVGIISCGRTNFVIPFNASWSKPRLPRWAAEFCPTTPWPVSSWQLG